MSLVLLLSTGNAFNLFDRMWLSMGGFVLGVSSGVDKTTFSNRGFGHVEEVIGLALRALSPLEKKLTFITLSITMVSQQQLQINAFV